MPSCRRRRPCAATILAWVSMSAVLGPFVTRAEPKMRVIPLAVWVATSADGEPVVDEGFVSSQLKWANRLFERFSVRFELATRETMAGPHAKLETRADRDALAAYRQPGALHVFFVQSLRDVDEPERLRMGVHWRLRSDRAVHFVVISSIAVQDVLAHELGHFFGNAHSDVPNNIMSYRRDGDAEPFFDDRQGRRIERSLLRYLESGELRLVR